MKHGSLEKIAFLSMDDLEGYVSDDDLVYGPLRELGWQVEIVSWRRPRANWRKYAAVIIRTTWDYQKDLPSFLRALTEIERDTKLANPSPLVRWNAEKTYLRELEQKGVRIVPTIWGAGALTGARIDSWCEGLQTAEIIVKPIVSANAENTFRLPRGAAASGDWSVFDDSRPYLVQPFVRSVVEEGEFSLFYFGGAYSHAILKTPKANDFRVQEEHGGLIQAVPRPAEDLLRAGEGVRRLIEPAPLYARADFVRDGHGDFALMELELIEPSLYLRMDDGAPQRFAAEINRWLRHG